MAANDKEILLRRLTQAPPLAWPTLLLFAGILVVFAIADSAALLGKLPLWIAMLINSVAIYWMFSVVHDSIHRSVSQNQALNDLIGRIAILMLSPVASLGLFRWGHIQHHRFASGAKDPDTILRGPWWSLPLRWMFIDTLYLIFTLQSARKGDKVAQRFVRPTLIATTLFVAALIALVVSGYGEQVLMLWFIPTRAAGLMLGFSFFWLPHLPHDVTQEENFHRATTVRLGWEWLLTPLLQHQNFHLLHHLYPGAPHYNNGPLWRLLEDDLRQHDLAIQHDFALHPVIHPGTKSK